MAGAVSNQLLVWYPAAALKTISSQPLDRTGQWARGSHLQHVLPRKQGLIGHSFRGSKRSHLEGVGDLRVPGGRVQNIGHCLGTAPVSGRSSSRITLSVQEKTASAWCGAMKCNPSGLPGATRVMGSEP